MSLLSSALGRLRQVADESQLGVDCEHLVEAIVRGEPAAEAEFAERYHGRIFTVALHRMRDSDAARDVTQETILNVLISLREGRLRDPRRLPAFTYGTARNLINNYERSSDRRNETPLQEELSAPPDLSDCDFQRRQLVRDALLVLPPRDREILHLTFLEELKPKEIAQLLELHPDVVRARKSRALKRIRKEIKSLVTRRKVAATRGNEGVGVLREV